MSLLLQISDPHFGTEQRAVMEALLRVVHEQGPDVVVLSGDITQRARRAQFRAAREFVDRLAVPATLVLPGNHDIPLFNLVARMFYPYANHQRVFGRTLEPVLASPDLLVIGVNTTRPSRHIDGEVSADQIQRVAQCLRRATREQLRIVVTHQPVHVPRLEEEKNVLHGHRDAVHEWANAGVDLLMGGHIHLPYVRPLTERFNDLPRTVWVVQAGTAVSTRVRYDAPNSLNLVRYTATDRPQRCVVERWDHRAVVHRFEPVECTEIHLDRLSAGREGDPRNAGKKP